MKETSKYLIFIFFISLLGCREKMDYTELETAKNIEYHELHGDYRKQHFYNYQNIYNSIYDSIDLWRDDRVYEVAYYFPGLSYQIDSSLVFNEDNTRFYTTYNDRVFFPKDGKMDYIGGLVGAKINNKWYFYFGGNYIVFRSNYQDSIYAPLTFEELSYVSHKSPMKGLLKRGINGEIEVNEKRLNHMFFEIYPGWDKRQIDSMILAKNHRMHQKKLDPEEIKRIKKKIENSVQPPEPISSYRPESQTILQWLFRIKVKQVPDIKIFESEAWKNSKKKKEK